MQYQNEDMDELFRRAADGYPLKLQDEGWDAVAEKLAGSGTVPVANAVGSKKSKRKKYKLALLSLLFLLISGTTFFFVSNEENTNIKNINTFKEIEKPKKTADNQFDASNILKSSVTPFTGAVNSNSGFVDEKITAVKNAKEMLVPSVSKFSIIKANLSYDDGLVEKKEELKGREYVRDQQPSEIIHIKNGDGIVTIVQETKEVKVVETKIEKYQEVIPAKLEEQPEKKNTKKEKRFYVGILAGPQFNQVRNQGFSNLGFSAGIVGGVGLSNNLSLETGFFISQKKYYSSGQYFSMKKISTSTSSGMKVVSLNGSSSLLEIPIKIKYDFVKRNRGNFFGTTGMTSYILTKESNEYLTMLNGNLQNLSVSYSKNGNYFTAAFNISAGYEFKAKQTTIRIEPYLQAPLRGIGVGSIDVMSTGIQMGVTLPFH